MCALNPLLLHLQPAATRTSSLGAVRRRGAKFLSMLAESDLWVAPEELEAFAAEVRMLLADVDGLGTDLGWEPDSSLPHYLHNFLRAAEHARARNGGVNIT